jgi:hypothetical protein
MLTTNRVRIIDYLLDLKVGRRQDFDNDLVHAAISVIIRSLENKCISFIQRIKLKRVTERAASRTSDIILEIVGQKHELTRIDLE